MQPIIKVNDLIKKYRNAEKNAVDGVSFFVEPGEFFTLLGPNGAGKTTIISILTTTLSKTSGKVEIAGFDVDKNSSQIRQNIGIIFQNPSLDINLTAEENIRLHAILYGLYPFAPTFKLMPKAYQEQVFNLAKVLGIQNDLFNPIRTFSGGMKRKLEIIRSLIHNPKVLFLDEPTTGLDPLSRRNLWEYLQDIRKRKNTTIFLTTHYLEEAEESDHIAVINQGKLVAYGSPQKIKQDLAEDYLILDAKDRKKLAQELDKLKVEYTYIPPFKVKIDKFSTQTIIKSINTPLTTLVTHTPTLEEAYLEIIQSSVEAAGSP